MMMIRWLDWKMSVIKFSVTIPVPSISLVAVKNGLCVHLRSLFVLLNHLWFSSNVWFIISTTTVAFCSHTISPFLIFTFQNRCDFSRLDYAFSFSSSCSPQYKLMKPMKLIRLSQVSFSALLSVLFLSLNYGYLHSHSPSSIHTYDIRFGLFPLWNLNPPLSGSKC